ncbi:MAG: outer membrane lipoprotein carrier protein LolA [Planctomycetes bacterium]|nr:outer membrane lipoprotein carrier protein LolA [Planctomycetota bacterium]
MASSSNVTMRIAAVFIVVAATAVAAGNAHAAPGRPAVTAATHPAAAATDATTAPAGHAATVGAAEMELLEALEAAGNKYRTIRARLDYRVDIPSLGDSEQRSGWVAYRKGSDKEPTKFRVTFETLRQGAGRAVKVQVDYAFDGYWLTVAKHKIRQMTLYQLAAEGEHIEPLRIGKGPFPLPFGQKAADMIKYFDVRKMPPRPDDPKATDCLRMTTRPRYRKELPVTRLEMWIDRRTHLPVKIRSREKTGNITTVTFSDIKTNGQVSPDVFRIPRRLGWETIRRPLKGSRPAMP